MISTTIVNTTFFLKITKIDILQNSGDEKMFAKSLSSEETNQF